MDLRDVELDQKAYSRFAAAQAYADAHNLEVIIPEDDELFIDIDSTSAKEQFDWAFKRISKFLDLVVKKVSSSKTEGHFHIIVTLPRKDFSVEYKILLQTLLGSDFKREELSLERVHFGIEYPTLFFEQKGAQ